MLEELHQPRLVEAGKEVADISVEHEVHPLARDRDRERIQRIMLRAPRSEPVRETEEVLLVHGVQHLDHRPLKDLVLQRRDPERPQPPVRLRYEHPARRPRSIRTPMNPGVQIPKVFLQIQPVVPPRDPIDPRGRVRTNRPVRLPQTIDAHVMKERGEPHIPVLPRHLAHTLQITGHALSGTASGTRFTDRVPLGQAPSLHHLRPRISGLVRQLRRYYGPV